MPETEALFGRALELEDAGRPEEALAQYQKLLRQEPQHADAWHNHGLLLARLGRLDEAEQSHRDYVRAHPESARARHDLADVLLARSAYQAAIDALQGADEPTALVRKGVALSCMRRFAEAKEAFSAALAANPQEVVRFAARIARNADLDTLLSPENIFVSRTYMAVRECDWSDWTEYVAELRKAAGDPRIALEPAVLFMALHTPLAAVEQHRIARHIAARVEARNPALPAPAPRRSACIRVGVLSPDFHEHVNAHLLLPLFELLDRARFELHAYSLTADDGSPIRARLRAAADGFRDLEAMSDEDAAAAIRRDDIDILLDVAGHTTGGRFAITARRPARVQANYLGFLGSLGSRRVDFAIADPVIAPSPAEWTESLLHLPSTFFLYDFRAPAPQVSLHRRDYDLPENAFIYCAFHKPEKIGPDSFALWMEVLRAVPRSVLWMSALPDAAVRRLRAHASAAGVQPERLHVAPFEHGGRYIARQRLGDLMLDALHHNAVTTSCDALAAGLPVLTLQGRAAASRACESLLRAAHLPQLVTVDRRAFVKEAVRLASDESALMTYRQALRERKAPLFDTGARVRELQACFAHMLQVTDQSRSTP